MRVGTVVRNDCRARCVLVLGLVQDAQGITIPFGMCTTLTSLLLCVVVVRVQCGAASSSTESGTSQRSLWLRQVEQGRLIKKIVADS